MTISTFIGFTVSVIATLVAPYLQNAGYGNLQGKIGFVWGSFSVASAIWTFFFMPELKGRSLEELDELFEKRVNVFRFGSCETFGYGARLTMVEAMTARGEAIEVIELSSSREKSAITVEPPLHSQL